VKPIPEDFRKQPFELPEPYGAGELRLCVRCRGSGSFKDDASGCINCDGEGWMAQVRDLKPLSLAQARRLRQGLTAD
jgi:hypothetical protein